MPTPPLSLPEDWVETEFETDAYGPDDVDGVDAGFEFDGDEDEVARLGVRPAVYRREAGDEVVRGVTADFEFESFDPNAPGDAPRRTVFAVYFGFQAVGRPSEGVFCLCADPDDAVAVAVALAALTDRPKDLRDHVRNHNGESRGTRILPTDREALTRSLAAVGPDPEPERCLFSGAPSRSHAVSIPVRYALAMEAYPRTDAGMVRITPRCSELRAVVSHREWTDRDLDSVAFDAALERVAPGAFRLDDGVAGTVADVDPGRIALATL